MNHWRSITGTITEGHGVASGKSGDSRFPQGTIALQKPFFARLGLDLCRYFAGTINVSIAPYRYSIKQSKYTFRAVKWSPTEPAEDFSFFDCRIVLDRVTTLEGLIYYPHPETKPEHFHPPPYPRNPDGIYSRFTIRERNPARNRSNPDRDLPLTFRAKMGRAPA
jgi:hypothetical protein